MISKPVGLIWAARVFVFFLSVAGLTCAKLVMGWGLVGFSVAFFEMPRNCEH
jgi:hypothetical protein